VRRFPAILSLLSFLALGSGAMEFLHNQDHLKQDAQETAILASLKLPAQPHPEHDESNCASTPAIARSDDGGGVGAAAGLPGAVCRLPFVALAAAGVPAASLPP